jgi:hypothetical protein
MKPLPRVEGQGSGKERQPDLEQRINTPPAALAQPSPAILAEWGSELERRLARAELLVALGLPDAGFRLLENEIRLLHQACAALRRAAA